MADEQVGRVTYLGTPGFGSTISQFPQAVERKWKCQCGLALERKRLVTKAKKLGKHYEVEGDAFALYCKTCGPVAWEA